MSKTTYQFLQEAPEFSPGFQGIQLQATTQNLSLEQAVGANTERLMADVSSTGVVLLRGCSWSTPSQFNTAVKLLCGNDLLSENTEHPKHKNFDSVFDPVPYAPNEKLLWHSENSFYRSWPKLIFFACVKPAAEGGETPLVNTCKVYNKIEHSIREVFELKNILYIRYCHEGFGRSWQDLYQTNNRLEAEARAQNSAEKIIWNNSGGAEIHYHRPALIRNSKGEMSWFNQLLHWHPQSFPASIRDLIKKELIPKHRDCFFSDGTPISTETVSQIMEIYQECEYSFSWQAGDFLIIDNLSVAHARSPYKGDRTHLVSLGLRGSF